MITVCVPVYNFNVISLFKVLREQAAVSEHKIELIAIDDASDASYKSVNESLKDFCDQYIELSKNVGRSIIRNMFLDYATQEYLVFLDCDGMITSDDFLQNYIDVLLREKVDIVSGGRIYQEEKPSSEKLLKWTYGMKSEMRTMDAHHMGSNRSSSEANRSFMTNNFLIRKSLLAENKFDESLTQYGHEDTLFSYELRKVDIIVSHIKNPVLDSDIEDTDVFIDKTKKGIVNLFKISDSLGHPQDFIEMVSLLSTFTKIKAFHRVYSFFYSIIDPIVMKNLHGKKPSIFAFNLFKLNELIQVSRANR